MPRQMGELRRLCIEWNSLVEIARPRGIRVRPRAHFHMDRTVARARVAWLRNQVAPFFAPNVDAAPAAEGVEVAVEDLTFGVELEFIMPIDMTRERIATMIQQAGVMCMSEHYNHTTRTHWKITTDASLGYTRGAEVVSPILRGEAGLEATRKVCQILTQTGCKVSKKCGLHVHVGCSNYEIGFFKNMARMYKKFEPTIDMILSPSRRGNLNSYCQPVIFNDQTLETATCLNDIRSDFDHSQINRSYRGSRFRKLNLASFWKYGTIEFRHHQGTVEAQKAEMWIRFCLRMVRKAAATKNDDIVATANDFDSMMKFVDVNDTEKGYFADRRQYFAQREGRVAA